MYAGLPDTDEFNSNACMHCGGDASSGFACHHMSNDDFDCNNQICRACAGWMPGITGSPHTTAQRSAAFGQAGWYYGVRSGVMSHVLLCPEHKNGPMVESSPYDNLPDTDEFRNTDQCMYCNGEFDIWALRILYDCEYCQNRVCNHCMERMLSEKAPDQWHYDYATDTGSTAICPNCQ
jgi:hypothetical protein